MISTSIQIKICGIPKTVNQQLVENSISHGFHDKLNDMYVEVVGINQ